VPRPHPALFDLAAQRPLGHVRDPSHLVDSAFEHRCAGLLWTRVQSGELLLPAELVHRLAREDLLVQSHHRRLLEALGTVLDVARAEGLRVVMAKGLAAETRWYDRAGERPTNDLDLVADVAEPAAVARLVQALAPDHLFGDGVEDLVSTDAIQAIDILLPGDVEVDLHVDLLKVEIPMRRREQVFERTELVTLDGGVEVTALDAELSLVHFLVHLNKDRFSRLLAYADVARIVGSGALDWAVVAELADEQGLAVPAQRSLRRVTDTLGLPVPAWAVEPAGWRGRVWDRLWPVEDALRGEEGLARRRWRQYWLPWLARGRQPDALAWFVKRRVLPPAPYVDYYYGGTGPYLVRLLRGRVGRYAIRRGSSDERS
jgi:hypothetical protein